MARIVPRLTKLELAFTLCWMFSLSSDLLLIALVVIGRDSGAIWESSIYLWLATIVSTAVLGSIALVAGGRLFLIIPFLSVGYHFCLFSILLMTRYSPVETIEQLVAAQSAIYVTAYLFWLALLKIPLPRLRRSR